jgi:hypothetical protein
VIEATFRGVKSVAARERPFMFLPTRLTSSRTRATGRRVCYASALLPDRFLAKVGVPVTKRTAASPQLDETAQAEFRAKAEALASKYRTELLEHA